MDLLRTPDERFADLPGHPFAPHYVDVDGARMHYVDEGRGAPVLLLHGEPTWSYLYRKMIARLAKRHRVIAPDLLGFGRSDKPAQMADHTVALHVGALVRFLEKLDLRDATLVGQDWGGLIGLPTLAEVPDRFARVVVMNTALPDGSHAMPPEWLRFRDFVARTPDLPVGMLVARGCVRPVPPEAQRAYDAPFPTPELKMGPRAFPAMVPTSPDMEGVPFMRRAQRALAAWTRPALVLFSDGDPITRDAAPWFRKLIPSAEKEPRVTIERAGHFLQEDAGDEVAAQIDAFLARHAA